MQNLVEDVGKFFTSNEGVEDTPWESSCGMIAGAMVDEICELAECVFQDAERLAVVSFAQCLCQELASLRPRPYVDFFSTNGDTPRPRPGEFLLPFDFRQLFLEKLQNGYRSHANELITKYLEYLYRLDSGIYIDRRPVIAQKTLAIAPFGTPISRRFDR